MRTVMITLLSGVLLGVSPQQEIAALKVRVRGLERQLVMAKAKAEHPEPERLQLPNAPKAYWTDPDLFAEDMLIRDIIGVRQSDDSPAVWLERNKGFVGQKITWRGVVQNRTSGSRDASHHRIAAGELGLMTLQFIRGKDSRGFKNGTSVIARGTIDGIGIEPTKIKNRQVIHGEITVHVKGTLQKARTEAKR